MDLNPLIRRVRQLARAWYEKKRDPATSIPGKGVDTTVLLSDDTDQAPANWNRSIQHRSDQHSYSFQAKPQFLLY